MHAILAAAVASIGNARGLRVVRGRKRELATTGKKRLDLTSGQHRPKTRVGCRCEESTGSAGGADRLGASYYNGDDDEKNGNAEGRNPATD